MTATSVLSTLLTALTSIVTSISAMVTSWLGICFATGNEYIQFCLLIGFVGVGIGALKRLLRA